MLLALGVVWLAWLAGWLLRVELDATASPVIDALGLQREREGFFPSILASGVIAGERVQLRWRRGVVGPRLHLRRAQGAWTPLPTEGDTAGLVREALGAG